MSYWKIFRFEIGETKNFFLRFFKNPIEAIRNVPDWSWPTLVIANVLFAAFSGMVAGVLSSNPLQIALGLLLFPLNLTISISVAGAFIYYSSQIFFNKTLEVRALFTLLTISNIPFLVFHTVSNSLPPIDLVGLAFTFLLIIVGLVDHFGLPRTGTIRMIGIVYLVFFTVWIAAQISNFRRIDSFSPQSLDRLQEKYYKK